MQLDRNQDPQCNTLQCAIVLHACCTRNTLQQGPDCYWDPHCNTLQCTGVLQTATHCNRALIAIGTHTPTHCCMQLGLNRQCINWQIYMWCVTVSSISAHSSSARGGMPQYSASRSIACCSVLQRVVAACCDVLLQRVAMCCCSVLRCVVMYRAV